MLRRLAILLLIAGYVAAQVAASPHGHSSLPFDEHNPQPHVHTDWLMPWRVAENDVARTDGHRHHGHAHTAPCECSAATLARPAEGGHDDDCVYLPCALLAAKEVRTVYDPVQAAGLLVDVTGIISVGPVDARTSATSGLIHSHALAELPGEHCALYLSLRTLRI
jgi:hypothetical protein